MMVLVTYDVRTDTPTGAKRLRHLAKACSNYGQRVQYSVFECLLEPAQWSRLRQEMLEIIDPEHDSLRFYFLGANWKARTEHAGAVSGYDPEGTLII